MDKIILWRGVMQEDMGNLNLCNVLMTDLHLTS